MWPNPLFPVDLVTFTEEIPNGKLHFLCSESSGLLILFLNNATFNYCTFLIDFMTETSRCREKTVSQNPNKVVRGPQEMLSLM